MKDSYIDLLFEQIQDSLKLGNYSIDIGIESKIHDTDVAIYIFSDTNTKSLRISAYKYNMSWESCIISKDILKLFFESLENKIEHDKKWIIENDKTKEILAVFKNKLREIENNE